MFEYSTSLWRRSNPRSALIKLEPGKLAPQPLARDDDTPLPVVHLAKLFASCPSPKTVVKWLTKGVRLGQDVVKLEFVTVSGVACSTPAAVKRFLTAIAEKYGPGIRCDLLVASALQFVGDPITAESPKPPPGPVPVQISQPKPHLSNANRAPDSGTCERAENGPPELDLSGLVMTELIPRPPLTVQQLAARWAVCKETVYAMLREGRLRYLKVGNSRGTYRIPLDVVEAYERAHVHGPAPIS